MEHVSIDLWATNLEPAVPDLASWLAALEARVSQTAARGGHMLVLPEFACAQWLSFAPLDLPTENTMGWLYETGEIALPAIATMAAQYGVSVLAGTIPFASEVKDGVQTYFNRAWLLTPDGARHTQDKLSLTPLEVQSAGGVTVHGESINVFEWNGLRTAMIICLDTEFTDLWSRLGGLNLDLI
ncbi:MAG: nitrilase, partial [Sulfitobacter sp.]